MDQGTDVIEILANRVIPLRYGYVPVINRGQKDINSNKSIKSALEYETFSRRMRHIGARRSSAARRTWPSDSTASC